MVIVAARESETRKSSPKVADLMLRARALDLKPESLKNDQHMEDLYRQALALEPNNASAMVGLAGSLALQAYNFGPAMDESVKEKKYVEGRDLALKAKELDPDNPNVYVAIAAMPCSWRFRGRQTGLETELSLGPKSQPRTSTWQMRLSTGGEPRRAIELLTQAINLDPKHPHEFAFIDMGCAYFMLGDNDAAIEWFQKSLEINPGASRITLFWRWPTRSKEKMPRRVPRR